MDTVSEVNQPILLLTDKKTYDRIVNYLNRELKHLDYCSNRYYEQRAEKKPHQENRGVTCMKKLKKRQFPLTNLTDRVDPNTLEEYQRHQTWITQQQ